MAPGRCHYPRWAKDKLKRQQLRRPRNLGLYRPADPLPGRRLKLLHRKRRDLLLLSQGVLLDIHATATAATASSFP